MDLSIYDTNEASNTGTFMHLESPSGELLYTDDHEKVGITLLGSDSRKIKALANKQQDRLTKGFRVKRGRVNTGITAEQTENDNLELLSAAVVSFHHMEFNGKSLGVDDARQVFSDLSWIRDQAVTWINDTEAYLGEAVRS